ncbi:uncharacterized protein LOC141848791 isoform X2 [Brevipalpus obovatus]|uniref:uncharacterized protein LOC141848791 isoform X2 n=1 Tax=Brevipalpus obovatus TaxID=246614 RepID=UPI003D9FAE1C
MSTLVEVDLVDGIEFLSFETQDDLDSYAKTVESKEETDFPANCAIHPNSLLPKSSVQNQYHDQLYPADQLITPHTKSKKSVKVSHKKNSLHSKQKVEHQLYTSPVSEDLLNPDKLESLYQEFADQCCLEKSSNKICNDFSPTMDRGFVLTSLKALDSGYVRVSKAKEVSNICSTPTNISKSSDSLSTASCSAPCSNFSLLDQTTVSNSQANSLDSNNFNFVKKDYIPNDASGKQQPISSFKDIGSNELSECDDLTRKTDELSQKGVSGRHSKREIRLPARYHHSGFLVGNQWVIPEYDISDKMPKKRSKTEDSAKITSFSTFDISFPSDIPTSSPTSSSSSFVSNSHHSHSNSNMVKPLNSCENHKFSPQNQILLPYMSLLERKSCDSDGNRDAINCSESRNKRAASELNADYEISSDRVNNKLNNSSSKDNSSHRLQIKLHEEKLEKLLMLKQKASPIPCNNSKVSESPTSTSSFSTSSPTVKGAAIVSLSSKIHNSERLPNHEFSMIASHSQLSSTIITSRASHMESVCYPMKSTNRYDNTNESWNKETKVAESDIKNCKKQELREAYRNLYLENKPERKSACLKSRIKPRVNKKAAVEESIRIIKNLTKREKQLEYIKKLLTAWNRKLTMAATVINDKGHPKAADVVNNVLKTYQSSWSCKVSELVSRPCSSPVKATSSITSSDINSSIAIPQPQTSSQSLSSSPPVVVSNVQKTPKSKTARRAQRMSLADQYSSNPVARNVNTGNIVRSSSPLLPDQPNIPTNKKTYANLSTHRRVIDTSSSSSVQQITSLTSITHTSSSTHQLPDGIPCRIPPLLTTNSEDRSLSSSVAMTNPITSMDASFKKTTDEVVIISTQTSHFPSSVYSPTFLVAPKGSCSSDPSSLDTPKPALMVSLIPPNHAKTNSNKPNNLSTEEPYNLNASMMGNLQYVRDLLKVIREEKNEEAPSISSNTIRVSNMVSTGSDIVLSSFSGNPITNLASTEILMDQKHSNSVRGISLVKFVSGTIVDNEMSPKNLDPNSKKQKDDDIKTVTPKITPFSTLKSPSIVPKPLPGKSALLLRPNTAASSSVSFSSPKQNLMVPLFSDSLKQKAYSRVHSYLSSTSFDLVLPSEIPPTNSSNLTLSQNMSVMANEGHKIEL